MQDLLDDENIYDRANTFYQKFNVDNDHRVYRFANLFDATNNKILVDLPTYYTSIEE